jgi:hypothetical protein
MTQDTAADDRQNDPSGPNPSEEAASVTALAVMLREHDLAAGRLGERLVHAMAGRTR